MAEYRIAKSIGRGGMGQVLLAVQRGLGGFEKLVVIKRLHAEHLEDEASLAMFLDEARVAASLSHPNIVQVHDVQQDRQGPYIVMEYLAGETLQYLQRWARAGRRIPFPVLCRIIADIAQGLHHAHSATDARGESRGIVHRDVSPSNLIVCFTGVSKLVDFGVAKAAENTRKTMAGTVKGKLSYLSPEQVQCGELDGRVDVFQLGIVLHELLTAQPLFEVKDLLSAVKAVTRQPIPRPSELVPDVPVELESVALRALERERDKRYQTAEAMARALEEAAECLGGIATTSAVSAWLKENFGDRCTQREQVEREVLLDANGSATLHTPPPLLEQSGRTRRSGADRSQPTPTAHRAPPQSPSRSIGELSPAAVRPPPLPKKEPGNIAVSRDRPISGARSAARSKPSFWAAPLISSVVSGFATAAGVLVLTLHFQAGDAVASEPEASIPVDLEAVVPSGDSKQVAAPAEGLTVVPAREVIGTGGETAPAATSKPKRVPRSEQPTTPAKRTQTRRDDAARDNSARDTAAPEESERAVRSQSDSAPMPERLEPSATAAAAFRAAAGVDEVTADYGDAALEAVTSVESMLPSATVQEMSTEVKDVAPTPDGGASAGESAVLAPGALEPTTVAEAATAVPQDPSLAAESERGPEDSQQPRAPEVVPSPQVQVPRDLEKPTGNLTQPGRAAAGATRSPPVVAVEPPPAP